MNAPEPGRPLPNGLDAAAPGRPSPPRTRRDEDAASALHGVTVPDPYRWLEDGESAETRSWIAEQNAWAASHLQAIPVRNPMRAHLAELWSTPSTSAPWRRGAHWFELRHDGVCNQEILWIAPAAAERSGAAPPPNAFRAFLDVNGLSADGTVSLAQLSVDPAGRRLAYALADAGSDWVVWRVRDVASGTDLPDVVPWSKFGNAAWLPDGSGFLYPSYDPPAAGAEFAATNRDQKLRLHRLGREAATDVVVYEDPAHPDRSFDPYVTHDGRWLVVSVFEGTSTDNAVLLARLEGDTIGPLRPLLGTRPAQYTILGAAGGRLVFLVTDRAPQGRIIAVDPEAAEPKAREMGATASTSASIPTEPTPAESVPTADPDWWFELVAESDARIDAAWIAGGSVPGTPGWLVLHRWHHATSRLQVLPLVWGDRSGTPPDAPGERDLGVTQTSPRRTAPTQVGRRDEPSSRSNLGLDLAATRAGRLRPIEVPGEPGAVVQLTTNREGGRIHLRVETFLAPPQVYTGDLGATGPDTAVALAPREATDAAGRGRGASNVPLRTEQVFVEHDGVRLPVFLLHREDVVPNGSVPTILYGYGGFDVAITPSYSVPFRVWAERGGLVAVACLRGGGEYGKAWHDAGRTPNKQNVFDDAIAVAEWLTGTERRGTAGGSAPASSPRDAAGVAGRPTEPAPGRSAADARGPATAPCWTSPSQLGLLGRSNGGLLVGACLTQRPDLFGACVPEVGVLDMLRFHLFTIGWAWVSDYGSAEDPAQFRELLAYSPLHNLRPGVAYPPTLVTTGDHDDRVVPAHSFKFAARLQEVQGGPNPTLLRIDVAAGHGAGKPLAKKIDERADVLAFFAQHLGLGFSEGSGS